MKIHHVLLNDFIGQDQLETLCNRLVQAVHIDDKLSHFVTEAGNTVQCVGDPRDVTCSTCQHVWRNIK